MIIHEPKKKTCVEAICFSVRGPASAIGEFQDWSRKKFCETAAKPDKDGMLDGTWCSPIRAGGSGPYWDVRCYTQQAAAEVRAWLKEHGFTFLDFEENER